MKRYVKAGLALCVACSAFLISLKALATTPEAQLPVVTDLTGQQQVQVGDVVATLTPVPGEGCYSATGYGVLSTFKEGTGGSHVILNVRDDCKVVVQTIGTLAGE